MDEKDKIVLQGLAFYGYHGLFDEEGSLGQKFIVDLDLYMDIKAAAQNDRMEDGVHYGQVYESVKQIVEGQPVKLIETLAERIASSLLSQFDLLEAVKVKVSKPEAPIPGIFENVAVEITRKNKDGQS